MELAVFMMEDGAAILLLAKTADSSSLDVLQTISLVLTLICALAFLVLIVHGIRNKWENGFDCAICLALPLYLALVLGFSIGEGRRRSSFLGCVVGIGIIYRIRYRIICDRHVLSLGFSSIN